MQLLYLHSQYCDREWPCKIWVELFKPFAPRVISGNFLELLRQGEPGTPHYISKKKETGHIFYMVIPSHSPECVIFHHTDCLSYNEYIYFAK